MNKLVRGLISVIVTGAVFAALAQAGAETCTLELKRLEPLKGGQVVSGRSSDFLSRTTYPQVFFMQIRAQGDALATTQTTAEFFKKIVKKEPKYRSEYPFRGAAKLGSQQYAFALDAKPTESGSKSSESESEGPKSDSQAAKSEQKQPKAIRYNRLYFDLNHNGDLTDDGVVEAEQRSDVRFPPSYAHSVFPRVDVTIDVDGMKVEYAFIISVYSHGSSDYAYTQVSLNAAAYREGEITLDGTPRHIVVLDFNSNGRFDDEFEIRESGSGQIYSSFGDVLLVDPDLSRRQHYYSFELTAPDGRQPMSKLVHIDGRFYDVNIPPAGDKLALTLSSRPVGHVTSPNEGFCALVYNDQGCVKIGTQEKSKPIPLPEGDWKLLSYTIDRTGSKKASESDEGGSLLEVLSDALVVSRSAPRLTRISAGATTDCEAVKVRRGETVAMPFGPPYKPVVKVVSGAGQEVARLEMSLVGSGGERCSDLVVNGGRPAKPEFTISTSDGAEVEQGKFEWG